jgi:hypothetical protein
MCVTVALKARLVVSDQTVQLVFFCLHLVLHARVQTFDVMR